MSRNKGLIPREGFSADVILRLIRRTVLNPALLLPLVLLARLTRKGRDISILHPRTFSRLNTLLLIVLARGVSNWWSDKARNNWVDDDYDWSKEIVVVTGGADGIGGRMVKLLEKRGITTVVLDIRPMSFDVSSKVHHFQCDLRELENVASVAEKIRSQVGDPTVLVNNAGVIPGKSVLDSEPEDVRLAFDVNVLAHCWTVKTFLPRMIANNHGMVVTIGSYAPWMSIPNMVDYGASKAAALAFHQGLTAELLTRYKAPRIRTVMVHPGITKTNLVTGYKETTNFMVPMLEPESIAEAIVEQILTGRSGKVILPEAGRFLSALDALPDWYAVPLRANAQSCMINSRGRQVNEDVNAAYTEYGVRMDENDTSESTVLV